jgi:hypothetical protein
LKNRSVLTLAQQRQEDDLAVWKFQRIVMGGDLFFVDLPKDCRLVIDYFIPPRQQTSRQAPNFVGKGQLRSWSKTDHYARVLRRRKPARASTKVACRKLIANFRRPGFDAVKAVITHLGPPFGKPLSLLKLTLFSVSAHQPNVN